MHDMVASNYADDEGLTHASELMPSLPAVHWWYTQGQDYRQRLALDELRDSYSLKLKGRLYCTSLCNRQLPYSYCLYT